MKALRYLFITLLFCFSYSCKAQNIADISNMSNHVRISTPEQQVYAQVANAGTKQIISAGKSYAWFDKGVIRITQGGYTGRLLHGQYTCWYADNKQLKEQGDYRYGLKQGIWKYWNAEGQLKEVKEWKDGLEEGKTIRYDSLGREKEKIKYHRGEVVRKREILKRIKELFKHKKL